ncbi:hypothetical protein WYO_0176 [Methylobacterium sp. GXF4]|uniref:DUF6378 domain-containing protein n=1 Tax=Methylobacterium sp. GXF4 TaxID=1096546 RepID=UPI0002698C59|nr:DUF6378 domain-containing protein [Methylobacterium sp. GXF4]EIZ87139.1 hypothetical protein WYO_0176 [Methylobacterium sp. GXF4]
MSMDIKDTLAQRQGTHGEFADNADIMQTLKDAVRARPGWAKLDATKREALDMILHKVGRIVTGNPEEPDHWHDIAGYATLARDRVKKPETPFELTLDATKMAVLDKLGS